MNPDQLLKQAKAHFSANKSRYILIGLIILAWANRAKLKGLLGFGKTRDEDHEKVSNARYRDAEGNRTTVPVSDGTRALINRIKIAYGSTSWAGQWGNERCEIAAILNAMTTEQLAVTARAYHQATGEMLHAALYSVSTDPCRNLFSGAATILSYGLWTGSPTDYDSVLNKLENLNIY